MNLLKKDLLNFRIQKKIILVISFISTKLKKLSKLSKKNYQNPIDLFIYLRDGKINPKEVLRNQINFKSDLGEIKKGNPNLKSKDQIRVMQNVEHFFDSREKITK